MKIILIILFLIKLSSPSYAQSKKSDTSYFSFDSTRIYRIKSINEDTTHLIYYDTMGRFVKSRTSYKNTVIQINVYGLERNFMEKSKVIYPKKNNDVYNHIDSIWSYSVSGKLTSLFTTNATQKRTLSRKFYYDSLEQLKYIEKLDTRKPCGTINAFDYYQSGELKNSRTYMFIWEDPFEIITYHEDSVSKQKMLAINVITFEKLEKRLFLIPYGKWVYYDKKGGIVKEEIYKRKKIKCP